MFASSEVTERQRSMTKLLPYFLSNLRMPLNTKLRCRIDLLGYTSTACLLLALGVHLYTNWTLWMNMGTGMVVVGGLLAWHYFSYKQTGQAVLHIWLGGVLGMVVFSKPPELEKDENYTNTIIADLFLGSLGCSCLWNVVEVVLNLTSSDVVLFAQVEMYEILGLLCGSLVTSNADALCLSLLICAFCVTIISIRLKSLLGIVNLIVLFSVAVMFFFPLLHLHINSYGLSCFAGRIAIQSVKDLLFSGSTCLDRWNVLLSKHKIARLSGVLAIFLVNITLCTVIGVLTFSHKEWFIVVPVFALFALLWLGFHLVSFITLWKLMEKISECNSSNTSLNTSENGAKSMNRIMSSKGVRHFSLISQRLLCVSLVNTLVLLAIGWETRTGVSIALGLVVLPLESMTLSLFRNLGAYLGGTCTGYGLVAPANLLRPSSGAKLLAPNSLQDISSRSTNIIKQVQSFFGYHMIDSYGCDYSSSGLSLEYVSNKLKTFFDRRTKDGPRFDTYILYYSGDVYDNGEWALADNISLSLQRILEWWREKNKESGARLLLVLDTLHSHQWARKVSSVRDSFVAVQTCKFLPARDPESHPECGIGDFTSDWITYNSNQQLNEAWSQKGRTIQAVFGVSRTWTDFSLLLPTKEDFAQHCNSNFPKLTLCLIRAVNFPQMGSLCSCCESLTRCVKREKMRWLPPKEIDTGHGFKLVRS